MAPADFPSLPSDALDAVKKQQMAFFFGTLFPWWKKTSLQEFRVAGAEGMKRAAYAQLLTLRRAPELSVREKEIGSYVVVFYTKTALDLAHAQLDPGQGFIAMDEVFRQTEKRCRAAFGLPAAQP